MQAAHHPFLDLSPSTFSKNVVFVLDVFGEGLPGLATDPKNRREHRFLGLLDSSILLEDYDNIRQKIDTY